MPWTAEEFKKRHNKGLSGGSAKKAAEIANRLLASGRDEGQAIRIANSSVRPSIKRRMEKKKKSERQVT